MLQKCSKTTKVFTSIFITRIKRQNAVMEQSKYLTNIKIYRPKINFKIILIQPTVSCKDTTKFEKLTHKQLYRSKDTIFQNMQKLILFLIKTIGTFMKCRPKLIRQLKCLIYKHLCSSKHSKASSKQKIPSKFQTYWIQTIVLSKLNIPQPQLNTYITNIYIIKSIPEEKYLQNRQLCRLKHIK